MQLKFEYLFKKAMTEWPDELDLSVLQYAAAELSRYTVKGLSDDIEDKYTGTDTEVITRTLQGAIYSVIHTAAKAVLKVELSSIRPEAVRLIFEMHLKEVAASTTLNWLPDDYALAEAYFAQDRPDQTMI